MSERRPLWTLPASAELSRIARSYQLSTETTDDLLLEAEAWAKRRMAQDVDDIQRVIDSDVGYAWGYMMLTMRRASGETAH